MYVQETFFDDPPPEFPDHVLVAHNATDTSQEAASFALPGSGTRCVAVLRVIAQAPDGLTDPEIQEATGFAANTERPRRVDLRDWGWVVDSGQRRLIGTSGRPHIVWKVAPTRAHLVPW